ncbi:ABC transporter permease [Adlercreutzia sp. R25]|uniref:ABC transporter permease n=1 Tax=Adlercreutzia shanghongiae TaxID=3111773 RepID=UPI002DBACA4C|nr:ABC transporter permease [Adlercreutzia sp. R25]MEC4271900.1 ABC transporter permease [Adlercreutzia sp. R25]
MRAPSPRTRLAIWALAAAALIAAALIGTALFSEAASVTDLSRALSAPGENNLVLGGDNVGRDVLARTLAGGGESLAMALAVVALSLLIGAFAGAAAAFAGGAIEAVVRKIVVVFQAFPSFVLAVAIAGILGPGMGNMVVAIAAVYWTVLARVALNMTASLRASEAIDAARLCGAGSLAIVARYIAPKLAGSLAVLATLSVGDVVLTMAGLSFLGLGPERPTNEWGALMAEAQPVFSLAPWCILAPAAALLVTVVVFNLLGDTLRDVIDARTTQESPFSERNRP